jgi:predicted Zn-dependent peptidase
MQQTVRKHVFENGLTLLVDEAPELQSVAIGAWVRTGSRHEDLDSWGMCHFLEHMLFKGGKRRGAMDISKAVDRVGGDFNAFTSRENTCFHFYLPASELGLGSGLLKEILSRPLFASREIERERQVILQEIAMTRENPEEDAFDRYMEKIFGKHPIGRNILGSGESMSKITRGQMFEFFYRHYRPENMVLAVSGAARFEKVKREFASLGRGRWPSRKNPSDLKAKWGMDPPVGTQPGLWWVNSSTEQAHVIYGINAPVKSSQERITSTMIQQYLGGGMSSVLFDQIREKKGWAYTVYANAIQFLDSSLFTIYAGVKKDKVGATLQVCDRELRKVARDGIPSAELKRIKDSLIYSIRLSLESSESRMMTISQEELFSKKEFSFRRYEEIVRSVKGADVKRLVSEWMKSAEPTILVLADKPRGREWAQMQALARKLTGDPVIIDKE